MPHFGINQRYFSLPNCSAYTVSVCGMLRLSVRLTPFSCAACAVFCKHKNRKYFGFLICLSDQRSDHKSLN
jgi:hypothetical protein